MVEAEIAFSTLPERSAQQKAPDRGAGEGFKKLNFVFDAAAQFYFLSGAGEANVCVEGCSDGFEETISWAGTRKSLPV